MGRVLPRENSWVEAVPWRMLTQSTGSRCGWPGGLGFFDVCSASANTVLTAARPDVFRKFRLVGPFALSFDMLIRDAFPGVALHQDRLIRTGTVTRWNEQRAQRRQAVAKLSS